jgi:hypothetical protein
MSFRRDLEEWVARQFVRRSGPKTAEHIRRLLRGDDSGRLSPLLLSGLPGETLEARPGDPEETEVVQLLSGDFCYYPISDSAPYGWGEPYENPPGTPVNPPLGTTLGSGAYNDASFLQYRRAETIDSQTTIYHANPLMGGRRWKRNAGRVLSWEPVRGWRALAPGGTLSYPIFYKGDPLVSYGSPIIAAIAKDQYIYAIANSVVSYNVLRWEIDWTTPAVLAGPIESGWFTLTPPATGGVAEKFATCDIAFNASEATLVIDSEATGGESRYFEVRFTWDSALTVTQQLISDSDNGFTSFDNRTPTFESTPAPCAGEETCGHCFQPTNEAPASQTINSLGGYFLITLDATIGAYYVEDTDTLVRTTFKLEMYGSRSETQTANYLWQEGGDSYIGSGYNFEDITSEKRYTDVTISIGGQQLVKKRVFDYDYNYSRTASSSRGDCFGASGDYAGSESFTRSEKRAEVSHIFRFRQTPSQGAFYQTADVWSETQSGGSSGVTCDSNPDVSCILIPQNATSNVDTDTSQTIDIAVNDGNGYTYNDSTPVPENVVQVWPQGEYWLDITQSPLTETTCRKILNRSTTSAIFGNAFEDLWQMVFMWDTCVGVVWPHYPDSYGNYPVTLWSLGDLMALTETQGNNPRIQDTGIGVIG